MGKEPERPSHASNIINALIIENASVDPRTLLQSDEIGKAFRATKRKETPLMHQDSAVDSH